jgi:hypothetical protein
MGATFTVSRCGIAIGVWVLCAAVRQVEIASDIRHAGRGWQKISDKIEDAVLLKLVVYKPRLGAGEAVEMATDHATARKQLTICAGPGISPVSAASRGFETTFGSVT